MNKGKKESDNLKSKLASSDLGLDLGHSGNLNGRELFTNTALDAANVDTSKVFLSGLDAGAYGAGTEVLNCLNPAVTESAFAQSNAYTVAGSVAANDVITNAGDAVNVNLPSPFLSENLKGVDSLYAKPDSALANNHSFDGTKVKIEDYVSKDNFVLSSAALNGATAINFTTQNETTLASKAYVASTMALNSLNPAVTESIFAQSNAYTVDGSVAANGIIANAGNTFNVNLPSSFLSETLKGVDSLYAKPDSALAANFSFDGTKVKIEDYVSKDNFVLSSAALNGVTAINFTAQNETTLASASFLNAAALPLSVISHSLKGSLETAQQPSAVSPFSGQVNLYVAFSGSTYANDLVVNPLGHGKDGISSVIANGSSAFNGSVLLDGVPNLLTGKLGAYTGSDSGEILFSGHSVRNSMVDSSMKMVPGIADNLGVIETFTFNRINENRPILFKESQEVLRGKSEKLGQVVVDSLEQFFNSRDLSPSIRMEVQETTVNVYLTINISATNITAENVQVGINNKMIKNGGN